MILLEIFRLVVIFGLGFLSFGYIEDEEYGKASFIIFGVVGYILVSKWLH